MNDIVSEVINAKIIINIVQESRRVTRALRILISCESIVESTC